MASSAVIERNRRNALNSTGPKTSRGKRHARRNATKLGLFTRLDLFGEKQAEFDALRGAIFAEFQPDGLLERFEAEEITHAEWALQRANRARDLLVNKEIQRVAEQRRERWPETS